MKGLGSQPMAYAERRMRNVGGDTPPLHKAKRSRRRVYGVLAAFVVMLGMGAYFVVPLFLGRFLEGDKIRTLIAGRTARELGGQAGFGPMSWRGLSVYSAGFLATAAPPRALTEMRAEELFARCSLWELWHGLWRVDQLTAHHLQVVFGADAARQLNRKEFPTPELVPAAQTETPFKVDIRKVSIAQTDVFWGGPTRDGGQFRNVQTTYYPDGKNLIVQGGGGTFHQANWPEARVVDLKLYYAKPDLRVDEARLTLGGESVIRVSGRMQFENEASMDLQIKLEGAPIAPFLSEAERAKVRGSFDGDANVQEKLGKTESLEADGSLSIRETVLQHIDSLEKAAAFTGRPELNPLRITEAGAKYELRSGRLAVRDLSIEAGRMLSLRGRFTVREGEIDGTFELGVAPEIVEKFPGAKKDVFTRDEGGFLWTSVKLTGPFAHPRDDLKPRLVKAAENHIAGGLLKPILKPAKALTDVIEALLTH